jgi:hypothetical protein
MQSTFRKEEVETTAEAEWTEDRRREELSSGLFGTTTKRQGRIRKNAPFFNE